MMEFGQFADIVQAAKRPPYHFELFRIVQFRGPAACQWIDRKSVVQCLVGVVMQERCVLAVVRR